MLWHPLCPPAPPISASTSRVRALKLFCADRSGNILGCLSKEEAQYKEKQLQGFHVSAEGSALNNPHMLREASTCFVHRPYSKLWPFLIWSWSKRFHITTKHVPQTQHSYCGHADTSFLALVFSCQWQDLLIMKSDVMIPSNDHQLRKNWMSEHFPEPPDIICPGLQEKTRKN